MFWLGIRGARSAVVRPKAFLRRKSAAFSAYNAENIRKCNRHGAGEACGVSRLSFHFLFSKNECISSVMRPDPDLTQTRWIYGDLFDKTARIFLERYKSNSSFRWTIHAHLWCVAMDFPVVLCYTERKDANAAETERFSACTVSILQNGVSGWI